MKMVIYPSFQMIRYGNCVWVEIFDVSQIKVKLEKTEGGAWSLSSSKGLSLSSSKNSFCAQNSPITTPHRNTIFLTKSLIQTISTKMLSWKELDNMDHFAWGVENKRSRASCLLDVSSETYDTLRMICGDEVCFFSLFF